MKIYKIIDNTNGNIYIGKTEQTLNTRLSKHKCDKRCMSREILKNGDYKIVLIEETHDESRERYYIENTQCVNKNIPGRTRKEHYQDNKYTIINKSRKYYQNNKETVNKKGRISYQDNRETKLQYQKQYYKDNKDKVSEYQKQKNIYKNSFGGDPRFNNNLLKIDPNLFLY